MASTWAERVIARHDHLMVLIVACLLLGSQCGEEHHSQPRVNDEMFASHGPNPSINQVCCPLARYFSFPAASHPRCVDCAAFDIDGRPSLRWACLGPETYGPVR